MTDTIGAWLAHTSLSALVNYSPFVWATLETLHFVGLAVLIGTVGVLDLRLLGFLRGLALGPLRAFLPWMIGAFALNLSTGALFLVGSPFQYIHNPAFGLKMLFVGVAGINALVFTLLAGEQSALVGAGADTSLLAKTCGAVSLFSWFAVLYFGRMLPYWSN